MADENYSSLREAINRIVGAPAGGAQTADDQTVALAPKASYSQNLQAVTPTTTTAAISNTPYDPFAEQNAANAASLAAIKVQNDTIAAQLAPAAGTPAAVPAATTVAANPTTAAPALGIAPASYASYGQTIYPGYDVKKNTGTTYSMPTYTNIYEPGTESYNIAQASIDQNRRASLDTIARWSQ